MDGGGRLDQPLMRSGQSAAERNGAPVDRPDSARVQAAEQDHSAHRIFPFFASRGARRWAARLARIPAGVGVGGSVLLLTATLGYGAIVGGHVAAVADWLKDARDRAANAVGFAITASVGERREPSQPRTGDCHCRCDGPVFVVVL